MSGSPHGPDDRSWARQLLVSALALSRAALRLPVAPGLTVPEALVLWWLTRYPGCTAGQLSSDLGVEPSGASVAIHDLERRGLLARVPDPRDRRKAFLRTTAPGRKAAAGALGALEDRLERVASSFSPAQVEAATRVLEELIAALAAPPPPASNRRGRPGDTGRTAPGGKRRRRREIAPGSSRGRLATVPRW